MASAFRAVLEHPAAGLDGGTWLDLVRETLRAEKCHRRYPMAQLQKMLGGQPLFEPPLLYQLSCVRYAERTNDLKLGGSDFA
jgi:hypothetical protein